MLQPAVFLDRDGTLGGDGHTCHPDAFALFPSSFPALRLLTEAGLACVVITNQPQVGSGKITASQLASSFRRLQQELDRNGATLAGWYVCPHAAAEKCRCRKPSPHLLEQAATELGLDLASSFMVGDTGADMLAGVAAGCRTVLVRTGLGQSALMSHRHTWSKVQPDYIAADVLDAARFILIQGAPR